MAEDDESLICEFASFGETITKVTDKNRPILIKKLNHLRARRRMSEKLSATSPPKSGTGRSKKGGKRSAVNKSFVAEVNNSLSPSSSQLIPPKSRIHENPSVDDAAVRPKRSKLANTALKKGGEEMGTDGLGSSTELVASSALNVSSANKETSTSSSLNDVSSQTMKTMGRRTGGRATNDITALDEVFEEIIQNKRTNSKTRKQRIRNIHESEKITPVMEEEEQGSSLKNATKISTIGVISGRHIVISSPVDRSVKKFQFLKSSNQPVSKIPKLTRAPLHVSVTGKRSSGHNAAETLKLSVQVKDAVHGCRAQHLSLKLLRKTSDGTSTVVLCQGMTDENGNWNQPTGTQHAPVLLQDGIHYLHFDTTAYFKEHNMSVFYPHVEIALSADILKHPVELELILNAFGYTIFAVSS